MSLIGRLWNLVWPSTAQTARQYLESLEKTEWRAGRFSSNNTLSDPFTSMDHSVLGSIQDVCARNRDSTRLDDSLDIADALLVKGFLYRLRCNPENTSGFFGPAISEAIPALEDCLQYCGLILSQHPAYEAVEISSRANLYLGELYINLLHTQSVEEYKQKAKEYLLESKEQSQKIEDPARVSVCQNLLTVLDGITPKW